MPGSYLEIKFKKNQIPKINYYKYWKSENLSLVKNINKNKNYISELDEKLTETVKNQIFADVEVGTFLSGGIDSSLITAIAQEVSSKKIKTF